MWKMVALLKARLSDAGQAEASGSRFESMTMNRLRDCLPVKRDDRTFSGARPICERLKPRPE
jgi:hypothetical protein